MLNKLSISFSKSQSENIFYHKDKIWLLSNCKTADKDKPTPYFESGFSSAEFMTETFLHKK